MAECRYSERAGGVAGDLGRDGPVQAEIGAVETRYASIGLLDAGVEKPAARAVQGIGFHLFVVERRCFH